MRMSGFWLVRKERSSVARNGGNFGTRCPQGHSGHVEKVIDQIYNQTMHHTDIPPEYIGQLEGELAQKAQEADDLRIKNQELMAENKRLNDLTQMLLSSSSFSSFLSEIGQPSSFASKPVPTTDQPVKTESHDAGSSQSVSEQSLNQHHLNTQVGMTFVPESQLSYGNFSNQDNSLVDENDTSLYDAQIFAVTSIPEGPSVNELTASALSGKPSKESSSLSAPTMEKAQLPNIELMFTPSADGESNLDSSDLDSDGCDPFDLYSSKPCTGREATEESTTFSPVGNGKAGSSIRIVTRQSSISEACVDAATMERFEHLCSALDELGESIAWATSRM